MQEHMMEEDGCCQIRREDKMTKRNYTREEIENARIEVMGDMILQRAGLDKWGYERTPIKRSLSYVFRFIEQDRRA